MFAIGEASRQSGVGIETIRYYEREGIVPAAERTSSGRRMYGWESIARLRFIKRCRDHGFSIADSRVLLSLSNEGETGCEEARQVATRHLGEVKRKITELQQLEIALEELVTNCAKGRVHCPILGTLTKD